jgi:DNA-binding XRE family transcriptional regulator
MAAMYHHRLHWSTPKVALMKKTFGELLTEARGQVSRAEMASLFGVSVTTWGNWERGDKEPNFETLRSLCRHFRLQSDYLLGIVSDRSEVYCSGCRERDAALAALADTVRHLTEALRRGKGGL